MLIELRYDSTRGMRPGKSKSLGWEGPLIISATVMRVYSSWTGGRALLGVAGREFCGVSVAEQGQELRPSVVGDCFGLRRGNGSLRNQNLLFSTASRVCCFHVFCGTRYGYVKVEVEGKNGARKENDEDREGSVLKIGHGDFHAAELDAPAYNRVRCWRFETHVLPISGLDVFKVVGPRRIERP